MGRKFAPQGCLGSITWDGKADSFESHVIQDCSVIQDWMDLHLGLRWDPLFWEYSWGMCYGLQRTSGLSESTPT